MAMDVFRFCGVFGLLEQLLYPRHAPSFLGLLHTVPDKDEEVPFLIKGRKLLYGRKPAFPNDIQRPGGCPEKMYHGVITVWAECKVTDDRGHTEFIGTQHQANGNGNEPTEGSFPGKTGFKMAQDIINKI